jgi:signal transduction histidine kinase
MSVLLNTERLKSFFFNKNAQKLQQLSEDILDVARIESQSLTLNKERFNLNDLVYDIVQDCKNNILKKDEELHQLDNDIFLVEADKSRLAQVISNLLDNSLKFTSKGTITVSLQKRANTTVSGGDGDGGNNRKAVEVRVEDTGIGINPNIPPRLFTKFTSKSFKGTGLGLFISKSIHSNPREFRRLDCLFLI